MADAPIGSDEGATQVVLTDAVTPSNTGSVAESGALYIVPTDPFTDSQSWVSKVHSLRTSSLVRLVGTSFAGAKDTNFWTETVTGSATVLQNAGRIQLSTGTTANSTAQYQSVDVGIFVAGCENVYHAVLKVGDTGTANNTRNWGAFNATNGMFFQLTGTTLNIVTRAASSDTAVAETSWNVSNSFVLDGNYHVWEIVYSFASIDFYIDNSLVHQIDTVETPFLFPKSQILDLPSTLQNNNTGGGATNTTLQALEVSILRLGNIVTETKFGHITTAATTILKNTPGKLHSITVNTTAVATSTITIYDNTAGSGTVIGIITSSSGLQLTTLKYNVPFNVGLTIVSTGAWDLTISYE